MFNEVSEKGTKISDYRDYRPIAREFNLQGVFFTEIVLETNRAVDGNRTCVCQRRK